MSVVVVSGLPRSGTSLVMQMLGAGGLPLCVDDTRPPDEDNPRGYFEYEPVKRSERDVSWLGAAEGRAVKVIHRLLRTLPPEREYRVILVRRDLAEVMASQRAMLARRGAAAAAPGAPDEARLADVLRQQLDEAEAWARSRPGVALLVVRHAALLSDPRGQAGRIARFVAGMGVPALDVEAMAREVDPALHRHRAS